MIVSLLPDTPPVIPPLTDGTVQEYVVPGGTIVPTGTPFCGDTLKVSPLQIEVIWGSMTGPGLIVTVTVKVGPAQFPDVPETGVTVYMAVWGTLVGLIKVSWIELWFVPDEPPVMFPVTDGTPQLYVVPAGTIVPGAFIGITVKPMPLHTLIS